MTYALQRTTSKKACSPSLNERACLGLILFFGVRDRTAIHHSYNTSPFTDILYSLCLVFSPTTVFSKDITTKIAVMLVEMVVNR